MIHGYCGRVLRVDLGAGRTWAESIPDTTWERWVGGVGYGSKVLYDEVPPEVGWDHPDNRVILASGPLAGTRISGSGLLAAVTRGPMTGGACSTQANGFFGAFIKTQGYDAIILQGQSPRWVYLLVHEDGRAELRAAGHLLGTDTWDLGPALKAELGFKMGSVFGIGPAGEQQVRFAALVGDKGHVAAHNGIGAVLGAKRLKAVVVVRGSRKILGADEARLGESRRALSQHSKTREFGTRLEAWGTGSAVPAHHRNGVLPVRNYTTNMFPEAEQVSGEHLRTTSTFAIKPFPCWACDIRHHCGTITITEGPYAGTEGDEPEYEGLSGMGPQLGVTDAAAVVMLANLVDRMGLDINETSWALGFVIECRQAGLLSAADVDGLDLDWGNAGALAELIRRIARQEGFGALLADGVKQAAQRIGGLALEMAVYTEKGNSPRGHDHRAVWSELLDTVVSNTGTIEATGGYPDLRPFGLPPRRNAFDGQEVAFYNARLNGYRQFQDSLGICRFTVDAPPLVVEALNAATGWQWTLDDAMALGRRVVHQLRAFNFRCGITAERERPSRRYASAPVDGPARGTSILDSWPEVVAAYYRHMGWDPAGGRPLPDTLRALGQEELIRDFWG